MEVVNKLLDLTADREGVENGSEVSVTFVTNDKIKEINRDYRGKDLSTDVISFAMEEMGEGEIVLKGADIPIRWLSRWRCCKSEPTQRLRFSRIPRLDWMESKQRPCESVALIRNPQIAGMKLSSCIFPMLIGELAAIPSIDESPSRWFLLALFFFQGRDR